jgi:hypothetical protein
MNDEQMYVIKIADRMEPGDEHPFSEIVLRAGFGADEAEHGSLEAAVCSHLQGASEGAYTLRKDRSGYILARHEAGS